MLTSLSCRAWSRTTRWRSCSTASTTTTTCRATPTSAAAIKSIACSTSCEPRRRSSPQVRIQIPPFLAAFECVVPDRSSVPAFLHIDRPIILWFFPCVSSFLSVDPRGCVVLGILMVLGDQTSSRFFGSSSGGAYGAQVCRRPFSLSCPEDVFVKRKRFRKP